MEQTRRDGCRQEEGKVQDVNKWKEKDFLSTKKSDESSSKQKMVEEETMADGKLSQWKEMENSNEILRKKIEELELRLEELRVDFAKWKDHPAQFEGVKSDREDEFLSDQQIEEEIKDGESVCREAEEENTKVTETSFEEDENIYEEENPADPTKDPTKEHDSSDSNVRQIFMSPMMDPKIVFKAVRKKDSAPNPKKKTLEQGRNLFLQASVRRKKNKRKNILGPCTGVIYDGRQKSRKTNKVFSFEEDSTGDTISVGVELGPEGQRIENLKKDVTRKLSEEANKTVEIGAQVGVTFNPDRSSAIEKLISMEKEMEKK